MSTGATLTCSVCGEQTPPGKFCIRCGASTQERCPTCGEPIVAGAKFCLECGTALTGAALAAGSASATAGVSERRLVSVLFADLVGFTSLSEHRDPEEVRELLSQYFERCRTLIGRYGGTVEKFIGDAVMAVWGTPVAREDDAERAVRAALSLVQSVASLGDEVGMPELQLRAGVLTGSAAVEVGAEAEGMVLGDTVNTASRLQSVAQPGSVLVDDVTRRASEAAIAYEDGGLHHVKGREQPVHAWNALRVVAGAGGARRTAGLEAPLVGRDRELQAIIDAGDRSASERRAIQISVLGEAGAGKSRLLWEFFKYLDGVSEVRYWHQGRSLAYGEGVSYWALAEMVRGRAGILEEDDPVTAREKLHVTVQRFVPEERELRLVEPRLAHLLRLDERPDADRADLFSGWRLFFERVSDDAPVIMVFEDLQWADSGLLDFIDYLLEWSADFPIFVIALGRPELRARRPAWEPLTLGPLEPNAIAAMLDGLAPGLPDELVAEIGQRAEGIPLYAVETIRMLQDRGVLVQEGARYAVKGDISELDVPETLQALVASRLDGLSVGERSLLQDASVLGQTFTATAAAVISGRPEAEVTTVLDGLVAKQVLARDDDPRSPERGQYVFLQGLLRTVAYGTLPRRARKARHVAAARHLQETWPGETRDIAEVLAAHYQEAIRVDPEAEDVPALRSAARETLTAAGGAAASLALGPEADRYLEQAAELAEDDLEKARLFEQAGRALRQSGDVTAAEERLRRAISLYERHGRRSGGSAAITLSELLVMGGKMQGAKQLLEVFRDEPEGELDPILRAQALAALGRVLVLSGELDEGGPLLEEALTTLELNEAGPALADALISRAVYLIFRKRREEGIGVLRQATALAERDGVPTVALRARYNLAAVWLERDQFAEGLEEVNVGLALSRERGDRTWERQMLGQMLAPLVMLGRWEEAVRVANTLLSDIMDLDAMMAGAFGAQVAAARGEDDLFDRCMALAERTQDSSSIDARASASASKARAAIERGDAEEALRLCLDTVRSQPVAGELRQEGFATGIEAALLISDDEPIERLLAFMEGLPKALVTPLLRVGRARLRAEQAHRRGDEQASEQLEEEAIATLRSLGTRPLLARVLLERSSRREAPAALEEARRIYAELQATRRLAEIDEGIGVTASGR